MKLLSDGLFKAFLLLALGVASLQALVGWQLFVVHREFRRAAVHRMRIDDQNVEILKRQEVMIGQNTEILGRQEKIIALLDRPGARPR